jgi:hypothetical protein
MGTATAMGTVTETATAMGTPTGMGMGTATEMAMGMAMATEMAVTGTEMDSLVSRAPQGTLPLGAEAAPGSTH